MQASRARRAFESEIDTLSTHILSGQCEDFTQYRQLTAKIQAFREAAEIVGRLAVEEEENDE